MEKFAREAMMRDYTEQFLEKVFYFCLKKCGNPTEAEDLAADISLRVLAGLQSHAAKGTAPSHFPAWVWKVARNAYAKWAEQKHKTRQFSAEMDENTLAAEAETEEIVVAAAEIGLLRRELAFIAREYREILVAFYIDDRKTGDIAKALGLPKGTVTARLFRSRQKLKEGLEMAREFGARSYKPENVGFVQNGRDGKRGEPWSIIQKLLCKNILLAAYDAPQTAEELAMELGVALPYMEDELQFLCDATLLRQENGRFLTNIFIVSAETQEKIAQNTEKMASAFTAKLIEISEFEAACFAENGFVWHEGYQPYADMQWARLMTWVDRIGWMKKVPDYNRSAIGPWGHTKRPYGGEWDLLGLEEYKGRQPAFVGLHGCMDRPEHAEGIDFGQFKFYWRNIQAKTPVHLTYEEGQALAAVARGKACEAPPAVLRQLADYGYLVQEEGVFRPTFRVSFRDKIGKLTEAQQAGLDKRTAEAAALLQAHYDFISHLIHAEIPASLQNDRHQIAHACETVHVLRGAVLEEALAVGYLSYDENDSRRMLGAYLNL